MKHIKLFQELALRITPEMPLTSVMLEEIARLREELFVEKYDSGKIEENIALSVSRLRKELAKEQELRRGQALVNGELSEQLAAAQLDAARYRWLRDKSQPQSRNGPGLYWYLPRFMQGTKEEQLDAAIDNAMQEEGK